MPKIFKKLFFVVTAILITALLFGGGLFLGVYYHTEILVVWKNFKPSAEKIVVEQPREIDVTKDTVIKIAEMEGPLPLIFSDTLEEDVLQEHLKKGAVVLPLGTMFGEKGNVVVTAHSSGNEAFGPYRFAFAKLSELEEGSEYVIETPTAIYNYRVYGKEVVWPHEVDKLPNDDRSTVTLVTCWPLWTNFKRLLVHSELIGVEYKI